MKMSCTQLQGESHSTAWQCSFQALGADMHPGKQRTPARKLSNAAHLSAHFMFRS
jgi:hypothetical protein